MGQDSLARRMRKLLRRSGWGLRQVLLAEMVVAVHCGRRPNRAMFVAVARERDDEPDIDDVDLKSETVHVLLRRSD